jgi:hypothetical protein
MPVAELRCTELEQQRRADSKRLSAAAAEKDKLQEKYYTDMVRQLVMQLGHRTFKPNAWDDGFCRTLCTKCCSLVVVHYESILLHVIHDNCCSGSGQRPR